MVLDVVKLDSGAVVKLLTAMGRRRGYIGRMPTFTLAGAEYDYMTPTLGAVPEDVHSWEYGKWHKVEAAVPLKGGGTVSVYGQASRWGHDHILTAWLDDEGHTHSAWIPSSGVRRLTASEWDIIEYHACPPALRSIRWGNRFPGLLPE